MQNSIYKIKYLLFLSWDWEAWCLTVWGVIPPPQINTAWNKGRKCFHCLGAPNNLIRPCFVYCHVIPEMTVNEHSKAHWSLNVPPDLTLNKSTFCPHTVFMCFMRISEQTAIISLYSINWLVFITEFNPLKPSGHYLYHQFNVQQFYVLPTHCIYVVCMYLRTNSDYFPIQH